MQKFKGRVNVSVDKYNHCLHDVFIHFNPSPATSIDETPSELTTVEVNTTTDHGTSSTTENGITGEHQQVLAVLLHVCVCVCVGGGWGGGDSGVTCEQ